MRLRLPCRDRSETVHVAKMASLFLFLAFRLQAAV